MQCCPVTMGYGCGGQGWVESPRAGLGRWGVRLSRGRFFEVGLQLEELLCCLGDVLRAVVWVTVDCFGLLLRLS